MKIFGRGIAVTTTTLVLIVALATVVATTVGVVTVHALSSPRDSTGPSSGTPTPITPTTTTTTTTTLPPTLATGPAQAKAPTFPTGGGEQPGYGNFNAVTCADTTNCLAVGADDQGSGVVSLSTDGGKSWNNSVLPKGAPVLDAAACGDSSHCVAVGQGAIVVTADHGANWSLEGLPIADTTLLGADCPTTSLCVASGITNNPTGPYVGSVVRSTDGGTSWSAASLPPGTLGIGDVVCPSAIDCVAVGASLLVSHDGGATWTTTTVPGGTGPLRTVSCSSATQCVAIGANPQGMNGSNAPAFAVETTDGGATWANMTFPPGTATLDQISCSTGSQCVAGGISPRAGGPAPLYQSSDGGATWAQDPNAPGDVSAIAGLSCPTANHCAVVGRQTNGKAATAASSDLATWSTKPLPGEAVPPSTNAVS